MNLDALFRPRGVAVFGSTSPGKLGAVLIDRLIGGGYREVYAVNPKAQGLGGVKGYASIAAIEAPVDLAVIASPASSVAQVLREAGEAGARAAVIITSGFGEAGHAELEREIIDIARAYGIRYIGPNCSGMINTRFNLYPTLEAQPVPGPLALVSQSGAVGGLIMELSRAANVGVSKFCSFGNGSDLDQTELLRYLKDDDETKVIAVYAENIRDGRAFMDILRETCRVKPVVIIKSGRTGSGQRAALSHTGSLAGADSVYDAAFAAAGAVRADSVEDMLDICKGLALLPEIRGEKLAIITNSGGPGVMSADACEKNGLLLPEPGAALKQELRGFLPAHAGLANPIDVTVEGTDEQYRLTLSAALAEYDAALVIDIGTPYLAALPIAQAVLDAAKESGKPVACNFEVGHDIEAAQRLLDENNAPCFASGERAVRALAKLAEYRRLRQSLKPPQPLPAPRKLQTELPALLEYECMELFAGLGIAAPPYRFVAAGEDVRAASQAVGYPQVMKIVSPQIVHKSDVGGVKLGIKDAAQAEAAYRALAAVGAGRDFRGVMLYPQLDKAVEIIVGFSRDSGFGPVVVCGMGGIYTEILKDISLRVAPVDEEDAMAMLRGLKTWPLLQGVRGGQPLAVAELARLIARFSQLPLLYPELAEGEINPVFVFADRALAADARLLLG